MLFVVNVDWFFLSHRLPIALAAKKAGFDVIVAAADTGRGGEIEQHGLHFIPIPFSRKGTNLFSELKIVWSLFSLYKKVNPDLVHHVTIKPVLFGSIIARFHSGLRVVNAITGLGFTFSEKGRAAPLGWLVRAAYRFALKNPRQRTIFQNPEDLDFFVTRDFLSEDQSVLIKGSGVNCNWFVPPESETGEVMVLLASRMIWDKGIHEFYEAAKIIKKRKPSVRFLLAGMSDVGNPNTVPVETLEEWTDEGVVEWIGHCENMVELLQESTVVALPTYYPEGVPKILIEAAACGRAIVTTDRPGCREIVRHGVNGILIPHKNVVALSGAIELLLEQPSLAKKYGNAGREIALQEFSERIVIRETMKLYERMLP
ncbi:MAG: glycosyltransferase family 4 protein [Balneolaceae bacterium]